MAWHNTNLPLSHYPTRSLSNNSRHCSHRIRGLQIKRSAGTTLSLFTSDTLDNYTPPTLAEICN